LAVNVVLVGGTNNDDDDDEDDDGNGLRRIGSEPGKKASFGERETTNATAANDTFMLYSSTG
jgi:hypothetical protein